MLGLVRDSDDLADDLGFGSQRETPNNPAMRLGNATNGVGYTGRGGLCKEPRPAIPLGWPVTAGASDRYIYVGDTLNHRVVRVDKVFATEVVFAIPAG